MDVAVSEKRYADAEQYRVKLKELAEEKALALEQEQHTSPNNVCYVGYPFMNEMIVHCFTWLLMLS